MVVNFIDAAGVVAESGEFLIDDNLARDARQVVMDIVAQYNALAPDWTQAPDWAQWCVIHANGLQYFYDDTEPVTGPGYTGWGGMFQRNDFYRELELPLGIDWRLCKWQRP